MNGIVPPTPIDMPSRPKYRREASATARSSQGSSGGAFQPPLLPEVKVTRAPYGGSVSSVRRMASAAAAAFAVGGRRNDSFTLRRGASTLPALLTFGSPSSPVTVKVGFHVEFSSSTAGSADIARTPGANGMRAATESPEQPRGRGDLAAALGGCLGAELREADLTGLRIRQAREQHAQHIEAGGRDAAARARMHPLGEHIDLQRTDDVSPQRSGEPEPLVVAGLGIEAHHETGAADVGRERLDVRRQIHAAALLARLDQHHTARVRHLLRLQAPRSP